LLRAIKFGCVETDVDLVVIKSDQVENDPEGFILVPNQTSQISTGIAYYPLDSDTNDAVDNNDGDTPNGPLAYVTGKKGNAASFDGNDYIDFTSNPIYGSNTFSVSLWFKIDQIPPGDGYSIFNMGNNKYGTTSNEEEFGIVMGEHESTIYVYLRDVYKNNSINSFSQDVTIGEWHHIACVITPSNLIVYLDGREHTVSITNEFDFTLEDWDHMRIGSQNWDGRTRSLLNGFVDEVRIYNGAISETDVDDLHELNY